MSKAKGSGIGTAVGVVVALFGGYILLKWLAAPKAGTSSLLPSSFVGGGYGGVASTSPYGTAASAQQNNSLLNALMSMLGKSPASSKGGAPSGGSMGPSLSLGRGGPSALQQSIFNIADYTGIANNMPLAQLNGASLSNYVPDYGVNYSIPYDTSGGQLMDLSQFATALPSVGDYYYGAGGGGMGSQSGLDTTSYTGTDSIGLQDINNFDVSSY